MTTSLVTPASNSGLRPSPEARASIEGFLEHLAPLAHDHGHVVDPDLEPIQERLHVRVALHVLVCERLRVSSQELSDL